MMAAGCIADGADQARAFKDSNLISGHAYGVIGCATVTGSDGK